MPKLTHSLAQNLRRNRWIHCLILKYVQVTSVMSCSQPDPQAEGRRGLSFHTKESGTTELCIKTTFFHYFLNDVKSQEIPN